MRNEIVLIILIVAKAADPLVNQESIVLLCFAAYYFLNFAGLFLILHARKQKSDRLTFLNRSGVKGQERSWVVLFFVDNRPRFRT